MSLEGKRWRSELTMKGLYALQGPVQPGALESLADELGEFATPIHDGVVSELSALDEGEYNGVLKPVKDTANSVQG
jgi:hypothetical protein